MDGFESVKLFKQLPALTLPLGLALGAVFIQIAWPLTAGDTRVFVTTLSVAVLWLSSVSHLVRSASLPRAVAVTVLVGVIGLTVEIIGSGTGLLFGEYDYTGILQPTIAEVPLAVIMAWFMMSWPIFVLTERALRNKSVGIRTVAGAALMTSWDLFLDPQMVGENYWRWTDNGSALPGIPGIPISNYAWWFIVSCLVMLVLRLTRITTPTELATPLVVVGWTWFGGVVAHGIFWGNFGAALWGGFTMGGLLYFLLWNHRLVHTEVGYETR